jgi:hypothetical protein
VDLPWIHERRSAVAVSSSQEKKLGMDPDGRPEQSRPLPDTRQELASWVRHTLPLTEDLHALLIEALERVVLRQEQLWQASKQDAIRALSQGFADQLGRLKDQLAAKDATVSNISEYFENLVSSLSEKAGRDAKTNLLNFRASKRRWSSCSPPRDASAAVR